MQREYGSRLKDYRGDFPEKLSGKVRIRRLYIDRDGYVDGTYYGIGLSLWDVLDDDGLNTTVRAGSRDIVKAMVREAYPEARFYR